MLGKLVINYHYLFLENVLPKVELDIVPWKINRLFNFTL